MTRMTPEPSRQRRRILRCGAWLGAALLAFVALTPVRAQQPRHSFERVVAAMCAKADVDGDSYRPIFCDRRCDCVNSSDASACVETSPGTFDITDAPAGACGDACVADPNSGWRVCASSSAKTCGSCDPGEFCYGAEVPYCARLCTTHADCTQPVTNGACNNGPVACATDADCVDGISQPGTCIGGTCAIADCNQASDCGGVTLSGVSVPDSSSPATCTRGSVAAAINANDALECIAQVETAIGQACDPFSP